MGVIIFLLGMGSVLSAQAQIIDSTQVVPDSLALPTAAQDTIAVPLPDSLAPARPDTLPVIQPDSLAADSLALALPDTIPVTQDSLHIPGVRQGTRMAAMDTSGALKKGEVRFQSTDSLVFNFSEDRVATLYGSANVTHQQGKLKAGKVILNLDKHLIRAKTQTPQDTLSRPVLTREGQPPVKSNKITFNYQTSKGRFKVARVKIPKGKITGTVVKNTSPHVIYLKDAIYSTCTLDHPHYYIRADKMKIVTKEDGGREIFFRNARLFFLDIPYPMVFPFGYLPDISIDRKQSGLLTPTYVFQNASSRGLGLRNVGWFQYFNDYLVGQISGDVYTSGTYYLNASVDYRKRDSFSGGIQIGYSKDRGMEPTDPDFTIRTEKRISIRHNQDFSPYSSISANINFRTADFYQRNSYDIDERVDASSSSSINYRYQHPDNLYNFNLSIRQNQNFRTNVTRLSGPSFDFSLRRFSPFASDAPSGTGEPKWYENISISYQNSFEANYDFNPDLADSAQINWLEALLDPQKYEKATGETDHLQYGFRQDASISMGSLLSSSFLNLSANFDYTEYWYPATTRKTFNADSNRIETHKVPGFTTAREFSTSLNFSTTFYGMSNLSIGNIVGFRHTVRPSISFSYRPDFSSDIFGYYRTVRRDTASTRVEKYSIFENAVFGGPGAGEQRAISFGISNVFEAKQVKRDSTGEKQENILRLIDRLNLGASYNFAADSLKLSNLNVSLTSSIVDGLNIRASARFNFYERNANGTKIDQFLLTNSGRIAELVDFSVSASTSFSGGDGRGIQVNETPHFPAHYNPLNQSLFHEMDPYFNRRPVQPFSSPWSFSVNFRYSWNFVRNGDPRKSATINVQNIQFRLTPKWSFSTRMGYDLIAQEFTPSQFSLNRQLHMWNLSFQMNPFGDFQYYFFRLSINSGALQSIFQKLPLLKNLERSSSPTGRGLGRFRY